MNNTEFHGTFLVKFHGCSVASCCITTAQLRSTKPEIRFCAGSNPAPGVSKIRHGDDI